MIKIVKVLLCILLAEKVSSQGGSWNYQDINAWGNDSPICNTGQNQSPVDLQVQVMGFNNNKPPIELYNYNVPPQQMTIRNNGHTVEITGTWQGNTPSVTGDVVLSGEVYAFSNAHVHWSTNNNNGTEHSINGQKFAMELHLVHMNRKYATTAEASNQIDGILVIAVLFTVNDAVAPNPGMQRFADLAAGVRNSGSSNAVTPFSLSLFLPNPIQSFYSYSGSLTTPPCSENVRWIIVAEPQPITSQIVNTFRRINLDGSNHNVRPIQPRNTRAIEFYMR